MQNLFNENVDEAKIIRKAVTAFGVDAQAVVAIEELSELIQALTKYLRSPKDQDSKYILRNITEEIADVEIMLKQLRYMTEPDAVDRIKNSKLQRLDDLIDAMLLRSARDSK